MRSVVPGFAPMKINTAISLIFLAISSVCLSPRVPSRLSIQVGRIVAGLVVILVGITLIEYCVGRDVGIDNFLVYDRSPAMPFRYPGRMSIMTASCLMFLSVGLLLLDYRITWKSYFSQILFGLAFIGSILGAIGYTYNVDALYQVRGYASMALHTALLMMSFSVAFMFLRPQQNLIARLLIDRNSAGIVTRRMFPVAIFLPLVFGALILAGQKTKQFGFSVGLSLYTLMMILVFSAVIAWIGVSVQRSESSIVRLTRLYRVLSEINHSVVRERSSQTLFERAVAVATTLGGFERACIVTLVNVGTVSPVVRSYEPREESEDLLEIFRSQVLETQQHCLWNHVESHDSFRAIKSQFEAFGWHSFGAFPIFKNAELVAIFCLFSCERNFFTAEETELLDEVVTDLGFALEKFETEIQRVAAEARIQSLNLELEERVDERTHELQLLNEDLASFSYTVSHDLRAPLRSIDGFTALILEEKGALLDEEGRGFLTRILSTTQKMASLIDSMLRLAGVSQTPLERGEVDLSEMARAIATEIEDREPARRVKFQIEPDLKAYADHGLVCVALENLMSNAYKFSSKREGAVISIGRDLSDPREPFFVRDNGVGFDPELSERLFSPFQRLHSSDEFPGTGVGLATVSRIVKRHGGSIWSQSKPGEGATFFFTLA